MGQPGWLKASHPDNRKLTQGTETSNYLEEKKTKVISIVVASEVEKAQTIFVSAKMGL